MAKWKHPFDAKTITSVFGTMERRTNPHRGTDYAPGAESLIPAVTDGYCVAVEWSNCLGWVMVQAASTGKHYIGYCHLSCAKHGQDCVGPSAHKDGSTCMKNLKPGDSLMLGQPAGRVGNTGSCSRGAHLHLTLGTRLKSVYNGRVYDIAKFIDKQVPTKKHVTKCPCCNK